MDNNNSTTIDRAIVVDLFCRGYVTEVMYQTVDILGPLEEKAAEFIINNDRLLYQPYFEIAERYCSDNSIIIGGRTGIDLIVGRPLHKDSFMWELYCEDAFNNAKALTEALSQARSVHVPARTAALRTDIKHKEFTVFVYARMLFKVFSMDRYRGLKLIDIMGPVSRDSYFLKIPLSCVPEDMQLIAIYRNLYTPARLDMWADELVHEQKIYHIVRSSYHDVDGGSETVGQLFIGGGRDNKQRRPLRTILRDLQEVLINKIIRKSSSFVLIGDWALASLGLVEKPTRAQFIADTPIESIAKATEQALRNINTDIRVTSVKYSLCIPNDFQIVKHSLYIHYNGSADDRVALADTFNSSAFEMIPFVYPLSPPSTKASQPLRVGNPWVLLRFLFIDIWIMKLVRGISMSQVKASDHADDRISTIIRYADICRSTLLGIGTDEQLLANSFQRNNYVGKYIDETVAKKRLIREKGDRFPIFYPAKFTTPTTQSDDTQDKKE